MRVAARAELPRRHLILAAHRHRIAGHGVMEVVGGKGAAAPGEIGEAEGEGADGAAPAVGVRLGGGGGAKAGERLVAGQAAGCVEISACPGAATSSARFVSGVIPGRGGRVEGSFTFHARPRSSRSWMKR
jgi:hypothetical protein